MTQLERQNIKFKKRKVKKTVSNGWNVNIKKMRMQLNDAGETFMTIRLTITMNTIKDRKTLNREPRMN